MVVGCGHLRRIVFEAVAPSVAGVDIDGISVSVQFPYAGHLNVVPSAVVEVFFPEIGGSAVGVVHPVEFPCAVEAQIVCAVFHAAGLAFPEGEIGGAHWFSVNGIYCGVVPFRKGLCRNSEHSAAKDQC